MSRIVLIDAYAILHRAYHAIPKLNFRRGGQEINALYGFLSMFLKAIAELNPDYLIACFDSPGINFRQKKFVGYQANRPETEKELKSQIGLTWENLKKAEVLVLIKTGFEADDIIGTLTRKIKNQELIIVTGDKDLMQLVSQKTKIFLLTKGVSGAELVGEKEVEKILGIKPKQVIDYKALVGDSSDNYPGVSGIGPKTGVKLLKKFSSLRQIYQHLPEIEPGIREKLKRDRESAFLSQDLATIVKDLDLKFLLKKAKWNQKKMLALKSVLKDLGFPSLVRRIEGYFDQGKTEEQMKLI